MFDFVVLTLAAFFAWSSVRYAVDTLAPSVFSATRPVHPIVAAALPLAVAWPDWLLGLAAAGLAGIIVTLVGALTPQTPVILPRNTSRLGLPPLP